MKKYGIVLSLIILCGIFSTKTMYSEIEEEREEIYSLKELELFKKKCSLCHTLDRVFKKGKLKPWEWGSIVSWMQNRIPDVFNDEEAKNIADYLGTDKYLFEYRCAKCHSLDFILTEEHSYDKWGVIVDKERERELSWISEIERERITRYISSSIQQERKKLMHEMLENLLVLEKSFDGANLSEMLHTAEALEVCAGGVCDLPPLEMSKEFDSFAHRLDKLTRDLKENIKSGDRKKIRLEIKRIKETCDECHGISDK